MNARDWTTNTPDQAAQADRLTATDYRDTDRDEPGVSTETGHDCAGAPFPDTCFGCLGWERFWVAERARINEANNKEWWA